MTKDVKMLPFVELQIPQLTGKDAEVHFYILHHLKAGPNEVALELFLSLGGEAATPLTGNEWRGASFGTPLGLLRVTVGGLNAALLHGLEAMMGSIDAQASGLPNRREMAWIVREIHDLLRHQSEELARHKRDGKGDSPHAFGTLHLKGEDYRGVLNHLDRLSCEEQGLAAEVPGATVALSAYNALGEMLERRALGNQGVALSLDAARNLHEELRVTIRTLDRKKKGGMATVEQIDKLRHELARISAELGADIRFAERAKEDAVPMLATRARTLQTLLQSAILILG